MYTTYSIVHDVCKVSVQHGNMDPTGRTRRSLGRWDALSEGLHTLVKRCKKVEDIIINFKMFPSEMK